MDICLREVGRTEFIKHACRIASTIPKGQYYRSNIRGVGVTISFHEFIRVIDKYTKNKIALNAKITTSNRPNHHFLCVWGIRDVALRNGRQPGYFPGFQEGVWNYPLETALRKGIVPDKVQRFRQNLNLLSSADVNRTDTEFYQDRLEEQF